MFAVKEKELKLKPSDLSIILSRKVDCDVGWRCSFKITLKFAVAPSPLNTFL